MGVECPKCKAENTSDSEFCKKCAAPLHPSEEISPSHTKTLETPKEEFGRGTTFAERYDFIEELGTGGMGSVYKVFDKKIKEEVALKILKPEIVDEKTIERFSSELKLARKIRHENVCQMYDINEEEGTHYITMEYVPGEDLKSFIRRVGQLPVGKTISIAKQVCKGLSEAHGLGVVHRDLKPQNIMIDKEGNARIMDFGIARSIKGKGITGAGMMIGTPEYMSPEQVEGKEVDQRSDIYSLGVNLFEMVTGQVPFEGDTPFTIGVKHKSENPKDPKELNTQIPEDLSRVILRCMEKDKENRYQSSGEVCSELEKIEKGIPTTERVVPERKPITSKEITVTFGLRKILIPALIVVVIAILAVIIWQLFPPKDTILTPKIENSLAVASFENLTGDKAYDIYQKSIPNLLITHLENTGNFYVVTWERMRDILKQMGKRDVEFIDSDLGFELCLREGVEALVTGSINKAGNIFVTDVKVLDVTTKKIIKSHLSKGEGVESILETQINELSREISKGIGIAKEQIEATHRSISDLTTTSIDAYNYFLRGAEELEKHYWDNARKYLIRSVELDPSFALAYRNIGVVYNWLADYKARNEAYEKAKLYSHKATEKERLYIEASYAEAIEGNSEKRISILKQIAKKYPKEKSVHFELGYYYYQTRSFNESIEESNKVLELDPGNGQALNRLAYAYGDIGDFEKAFEYLEKYSSVSPGDANPMDSMADIYSKMGKFDDAITKFKEVLGVKPDFGYASLKMGYIYALKEDYREAMKWTDHYIALAASPGLKALGLYWKSFYHYWLGNLEQSIVDLQMIKDIAEAIDSKLWKAQIQWMNGWIHYEKGEYEISQNCFNSWHELIIENDPSNTPFYTAFYNLCVGLVDLRWGRIDSANSKLDRINAMLLKVKPPYKDQITSVYNLLYEELLLKEGNLDKTIAICEEASLSGIPPLLLSRILISRILSNVPFLKDVKARAYQKKRLLDKAIVEYERLITFDPEREERFLIHPIYYYRLAKLYEEKGWKGKAIEHYEKFLDLWKDADPGNAEVEDARKRLAGLKSQ
jgi:serine/threonine protein kinase/Flp pilus assembly protein TadD